MFTPAFKKDNSWTLLCIMSISKLVDVKISFDGKNVISVPVSLVDFVFFSSVVFFPLLYFCSYTPPSRHTLRLN